MRKQSLLSKYVRVKDVVSPHWQWQAKNLGLLSHNCTTSTCNRRNVSSLGRIFYLIEKTTWDGPKSWKTMEKPGLGYHGLPTEETEETNNRTSMKSNKFIRSINHQNISTISTKNIFNYRICNKSSIKPTFVLLKFILSSLSTFFLVQDTRRSDSKPWHMTWILVIIVLWRLERFEGIKLLEMSGFCGGFLLVWDFCCWLDKESSIFKAQCRFFHGFSIISVHLRWFFQCCMVFCFVC